MTGGLLALSALLARGLFIGLRPNGINGEPSLRNQNKVSIYLSFYRARARRGAVPIAPIVPIAPNHDQPTQASNADQRTDHD